MRSRVGVAHARLCTAASLGGEPAFSRLPWVRAESPLKRACRQDCRRYRQPAKAFLPVLLVPLHHKLVLRDQNPFALASAQQIKTDAHVRVEETLAIERRLARSLNSNQDDGFHFGNLGGRVPCRVAPPACV